MTKKKPKLHDSLSIKIASIRDISNLSYYIKGGRLWNQEACYLCEELNFEVKVMLKRPSEEYFDDANVVFVRDALKHFLER